MVKFEGAGRFELNSQPDGLKFRMMKVGDESWRGQEFSADKLILLTAILSTSLMLLGGCAQPKFVDRRGDLGQSVMQVALKIGMHPKTTNGLPRIETKWREFGGDFIAPRAKFSDIEVFLRQAFGDPIIVSTSDRIEYKWDLGYNATNKGFMVRLYDTGSRALITLNQWDVAEYYSTESPRPLPAGLPTFGTGTTNSIRVVVFGMADAISQPGYYHLPQSVVLRDAMLAAHGVESNISWGLHSGIERPMADGSFKCIDFFPNKEKAEQIGLRDGDRIYFECINHKTGKAR